MNFEILTTSYFKASAKKMAKRYRSFASDLERLLNDLTNNPYQGAELTPGIRKIRMRITSKGKGSSGGARVITLTYATSDDSGHIYLLLLYDKSDSESVKINVVRSIVSELGLDLNKMNKEGKL